MSRYTGWNHTANPGGEEMRVVGWFIPINPVSQDHWLNPILGVICRRTRWNWFWFQRNGRGRLHLWIGPDSGRWKVIL